MVPPSKSISSQRSAEYFATPQAVEDEQDERRRTADQAWQRTGTRVLRRRPRADRAALPLRQFGQAGDVAHDEFFTNRPGERGAEHGPHDLNLTDGVALSRRWFKNSWTIGTVRLVSFRLPRPGFR